MQCYFQEIGQITIKLHSVVYRIRHKFVESLKKIHNKRGMHGKKFCLKQYGQKDIRLEFLLKIPVLELNNRFVFHRFVLSCRYTMDIQVLQAPPVADRFCSQSW